MELLIGILCGIALSLFFSFGPAFFSMLQNSVHFGFRRAMFFVIGVTLSDIIVVFLMLTILRNVDLYSFMHKVWVAIIGSAVVGFIGVHTFRRTVNINSGEKKHIKFQEKSSAHRWELMLHGFVLNALNPFIWIYWISIITFLSSEIDLTAAERYYFFAGLLCGTFSMDAIKCRLSSLLRSIITPRFLNIINKITGGILICFAVYILGSMIAYQRNPEKYESEGDTNSQGTRVVQQIHNIARRDSTHKSDTIEYRQK